MAKVHGNIRKNDKSHDKQPDLLRRRQELAEVAVALPVELAAHGLVPVPRDVGLDGVQPHRLEPQQAVPPVLRSPPGVQTSGRPKALMSFGSCSYQTCF